MARRGKLGPRGRGGDRGDGFDDRRNGAFRNSNQSHQGGPSHLHDRNNPKGYKRFGFFFGILFPIFNVLIFLQFQ